MEIINYISNLFDRLSEYFQKKVDLISCFFLLSWFWASYHYYFHYDSFYEPNGLEIEFYTDVTPYAWFLLLGYYKRLKPWGKITFWSFTEMMSINIYQMHCHFEGNGFILSVLSVFLMLLVGYAWCISNALNRMFNPNFYENDKSIDI